MFERVLAFLGLQIAKLQFRSEFDTIQTMTNFFSSAGNILIVLPVGYEQAVHAGNALREACSRLPHAHLTVVHSGTRETALGVIPRCEVVRMDASDLNKFSLPT